MWLGIFKAVFISLVVGESHWSSHSIRKLIVMCALSICITRFFRSTSKPLPKDSPTLIVFIIGGATASEVKLVADFVASRKISKQVCFTR